MILVTPTTEPVDIIIIKIAGFDETTRHSTTPPPPSSRILSLLLQSLRISTITFNSKQLQGLHSVSYPDSVFVFYSKHSTSNNTFIMDLSAQMFRDIPKLVSHHYKEGNINWPMGIYISLVHIVAAVGVLRLAECSRETLMWAFVLWPIR